MVESVTDVAHRVGNVTAVVPFLGVFGDGGHGGGGGPHLAHVEGSAFQVSSHG